MTRIKTKEILADHEARIKRIEDRLFMPPMPRPPKKRHYRVKFLDKEQEAILNYVIARNGWEYQTIALTDLTKAFNEVYLSHHPNERPVHCRNILHVFTWVGHSGNPHVSKKHNKTYVKPGIVCLGGEYGEALKALGYGEWLEEYEQRKEREQQEWIERMKHQSKQG